MQGIIYILNQYMAPCFFVSNCVYFLSNKTSFLRSSLKPVVMFCPEVPCKMICVVLKRLK